MTYYYINTNQQSNWDYEVHTTTCPHGADQSNRESLWYHLDCKSAVKEAKNRWYKTADWCYYCCGECHTS